MDPQDLKKFFSEAHWREYNRGFAEGLAEARAEAEARGKAKALLMFLRRRGLATTGDQQHRIVTCTDLATVERWLDRVFSVASVDELVA